MIIIDIEASGTNYEKHSIVSIGALSLEQSDDRFYVECKIWEGASVMEGALEVNGFTEEQITDPSKMTEVEAVRNFLGWAKRFPDQTLCGQNVSFDRDFLRAACQRAGMNWTLAYRTIDTHSLCWMHMIKAGLTPPIDIKHKRSALNLDGVLNYCGIVSEPKPHNALTGALCHAEVTSRLLYNKKLLPEFANDPIPWVT